MYACVNKCYYIHTPITLRYHSDRYQKKVAVIFRCDKSRFTPHYNTTPHTPHTPHTRVCIVIIMYYSVR